MRKSSLYPKLAVQNIKRNGQFYLPYMITCVATTAMFYIMSFLADCTGSSSISSMLVLVLQLGKIVIGIFSVIFLFYTNSFLMKRRQKELGLYSILGMGKGNISGMLFFETLFVAVLTISAGLGLGILLSKLILLGLLKLVNFPVTYGFEIPLQSVQWTLVIFGAIFLLILISNLWRIKLSSPIELLYGGNAGEREPKTKWVLALLGIVTLGIGYYIAIVTESPLEAVFLFFVAVVLVIIGTYLLFTASSIAVLKKLKANPKYYYKTKHFIPVSGMLYRMKQNAVGLANICILSTMVLVMVSGTVCLYLGTEDSLIISYPNDYSIDVSKPTGSTRESLSALINGVLENEGYTPSNLQDYASLSFITSKNGSELSTDGGSASEALVNIMSGTEYARFSGENVSLSPGQALLETSDASIGAELSVDGASLKICGEATAPALSSGKSPISTVVNTYFLVVSDEDYAVFSQEHNESWLFAFDVEGLSTEEKQELGEKIEDVVFSADRSSLDGDYNYLGVACREAGRQTFYELSGGFLFLGIFLGLVFLMATVLIIYYKQLSEGYDDRQRFEIMQKVGLSRPEIKKAIRSQILVVFFLPLGMAVIHIAFAFKMITKLLLVMGLTNTALFAICTLGTVAVFAAIYAIVYSLTAKTYYRVVE